MSEPKDAGFVHRTFRVPESLYAWLMQQAAGQRRSINRQLQIIMEQERNRQHSIAHWDAREDAEEKSTQEIEA